MTSANQIDPARSPRMESSRFDAFARPLVRSLSRRRTLAAMLASPPAAPFSALETAGKGQRRRLHEAVGATTSTPAP
jgi:hypothetical protein